MRRRASNRSPSVATTLTLALAIACTGGELVAEPGQIVSVDALPPGDACPEGGVIIQVGIDLDGDGHLDPEEVEESHVVCHGDTGEPPPARLVAIEALPPGDACPEGGLLIEIGVDLDGDGQLDPEEVEESHLLCHGESPEIPEVHGFLIELTELEVGDADCPHGGVRIDVGLDDGAGGGTAGDGSLHPDEIHQSAHLCSPPPDDEPDPVGPPEGPPGLFRIDLSGGSGGTEGATGGDLLIGEGSAFGAPAGDDAALVALYPTGVADASFVAPAATPFLGPRPAIVLGHVVVLLDPSNPVDGDYFLRTDSEDLLIWDDFEQVGVVATGLHVQPGATLTLPANDQQETTLHFTSDVYNEGRIRLADSSALRITSDLGSYHGAPGSAVDLDGDAETPVKALLLDLGGRFFNEGAIEASGATFHGGTVDIRARRIVNTGPIRARGGTALTAEQDGALGGQIALQTREGRLHNSGTLDVRGGDGGGGSRSGDGGRIRMTAEIGGILNTGALLADAGNCIDCVAGDTVHDGEWAIDLLARGGGVITSGTISARGGDASQPGPAGWVRMRTQNHGALPGGDINVSGDIRLQGGSSTGTSAGAAGGRLVVSVEADRMPSPEIVFFGYDEIDLAGGDGGTSGGPGGTFVVRNRCPAYSHWPVGGVANFVDVIANGGATNGSLRGGDGGAVHLEACSELGYADSDGSFALNAGRIDLFGGSGGSAGEGGDGGELHARAFAWVENRGGLQVDGGDGDQGAGDGGEIRVVSDSGRVRNEGVVSGTGGNAMNSRGGDAGSLAFLGAVVENAEDLRFVGGDTVHGASRGGHGGIVELNGRVRDTVNSGTIDVSPGSGGSDGAEPGLLMIDAQIQDP